MFGGFEAGWAYAPIHPPQEQPSQGRHRTAAHDASLQIAIASPCPSLVEVFHLSDEKRPSDLRHCDAVRGPRARRSEAGRTLPKAPQPPMTAWEHEEQLPPR